MKKRLLSMLLLAVMLVTAIPFAIFASAAEAATEEEPYDYNSLYVTDKMILAFDIMASNGFGGQALDEFPQSPITMTEYAHGGKTYDFTDPAQRYDYSGRYFVMKEKNGNKQADYNSGAHATKESAEAAMATAKAKDSSYTWTVEGPYNYLILRMNKNVSEDPSYTHYMPTVALQEIYNSTGYTTEAAAKAAINVLEQQDKNDVYEYFVIGSDTNAAYQAAGKAYADKVNAWIAKYVWQSSGKTKLAISSDPSNHANAFRRLRDSHIVYAPIVEPVQGDGYIVRKLPYSTDWGIQINGIPDVSDISAQLLTRMGTGDGDKFLPSGNFLILADVRPVRTYAGGMLTFTNVERFGQKGDAVISNPVSVNDVQSLTYTLTGALNTDASVADTFSIVTPNSTLFLAEGAYTPTAKGGLQTTNIIGYSNSAPKSEFYAIRYYEKALTAAEIEQNHFADIAKWYSLDMSLYEALSAEQKLAARKAVVDFVLADTTLCFSADTAARSTVQNKLDTFALDTIYGQLTDAPEAFKTVAKGVRADISGVLALPEAYRTDIYDAVLALNPDAQKVASLVQATISAAIDRILQTYYGAYMNTTTMTYKDIYVHQDNLVIWLDFFAAKATDGNVYGDYSYTDQLTQWDVEKYGNYSFTLPQLDLDANGNVQYTADGTPKYIEGARNVSRRAVTGDWVPNWHLPSKIKVNGTNVNNPDKIKIPEVSNMAEVFSKYVYKGGDLSGSKGGYSGAFQFFDLPDTGYGHTNIRTFGDGYLIGGHNNSFKVFSPGKDTSVTYQFVTNVAGNLQLDGYRANFSLKNGVFKIDTINYYAYGVGTDGYTLADGALQSHKPGNSVPAGSVMDLTITLDKKIGEDPGHYYTEIYQTNAEGAIKYTDTFAQATRNLYRYNADGTNYIVLVEGQIYTALYTVNAVGKKFYIEHDGQTVKSVRLVKGDDGKLTVDWSTAEYDESIAVGAEATGVLGPYYQNPFPEVSSETPGATGPIVYKGTYDLGVYTNGYEYVYLTGLPYTSSDIGSVGNSGNLHTYAIRTYNIVLTEEEIRTNHFADLAGFYDLDLAPYALLNATQKSELHALLAGLELGLSKNVGKSKYQEAIDAVFYNFDANVEGAEHFLAICHAFGLDTSTVAQLSPEAQARVFAKFTSVEAGAKNYTAILQKNLVDAVQEEIRDRYAAAFGHNTIAFDGWQLHQFGDFGMRALFSTNLDAIEDLEAHGAVIHTGLLMAEKSTSIKNLDALRLNFAEDGTFAAPTGVTLVQGYWDGVIGENVEYLDDSIRFTEEVFLGLEDAEEDEIAEALEDREFFYIGFSVVDYDTDEDGVNDTTTVFYADATLAGDSGSFSVYDVSAVAKYDYKVATKNVQTAMNIVDGDEYISASVGNVALESYKLVRSGETAVLEMLQDAVDEALGFELNTVRNAEVVAGTAGYIQIGSYDNLHSSKCYGISTFGGNIYIWANADAEIEDAVALFTEYLALQLANGADAVFAQNTEIVCRTR